MPKDRLPDKIYRNVLEYVKYRYSHKDKDERRKIKSRMISQLRRGGAKVQDKFLLDMKGFMKRNAELITATRKNERNHKQYQG